MGCLHSRILMLLERVHRVISAVAFYWIFTDAILFIDAKVSGFADALEHTLKCHERSTLLTPEIVAMRFTCRGTVGPFLVLRAFCNWAIDDWKIWTKMRGTVPCAGASFTDSFESEASAVAIRAKATSRIAVVLRIFAICFWNALLFQLKNEKCVLRLRFETWLMILFCRGNLLFKCEFAPYTTFYLLIMINTKMYGDNNKNPRIRLRRDKVFTLIFRTDVENVKQRAHWYAIERWLLFVQIVQYLLQRVVIRSTMSPSRFHICCRIICFVIFFLRSVSIGVKSIRMEKITNFNICCENKYSSSQHWRCLVSTKLGFFARLWQ